MRRRKGNIILIFIMLMFLASTVGAFLFLVSGTVRTMTSSLNSTKALYLAEAGLNKGLWYLLTPIAQGGMGIHWRPSNHSENFGSGSFTISVTDSIVDDKVVLRSTGRAGFDERTVQFSLKREGLPLAFDYALFNYDGLGLLGNTNVWGDIHVVDGNAYIAWPCDIEDGEVTVAPGYSVSGNGEYEVGETPDPLPQMPSIDHSYYDDQIAQVYSGGPNVLIGDQNFDDYNLDGQTIYVSGEVELEGDITGGGVIVATGDIDISGARIDPNTTIISKDDVRITRFPSIQEGSVIYAKDNVSVGGFFSRPVIHGSIIGEDVALLGPMDVYGLVYSQDVSFNMTFIFDQNIYGSIVSRAALDLSGFIGNINLHYDQSYLPSIPPPGFNTSLDIVPGTWVEI